MSEPMTDSDLARLEAVLKLMRAYGVAELRQGGLTVVMGSAVYTQRVPVPIAVPGNAPPGPEGTSAAEAASAALAEVGGQEAPPIDDPLLDGVPPSERAQLSGILTERS